MKSAGKQLDFLYTFCKADKLPKDVYTIKDVKNIRSDDFQKSNKSITEGKNFRKNLQQPQKCVIIYNW